MDVPSRGGCDLSAGANQSASVAFPATPPATVGMLPAKRAAQKPSLEQKGAAAPASSRSRFREDASDVCEASVSVGVRFVSTDRDLGDKFHEKHSQ